jgi:hypothetical protein
LNNIPSNQTLMTFVVKGSINSNSNHQIRTNVGAYDLYKASAPSKRMSNEDFYRRDLFGPSGTFLRKHIFDEASVIKSEMS